MTRPVDLSVYLVTDPVLTGGRSVEDVVAQAIAGGATLVQLRDPHGSTRTMIDLGRALKARLRPHAVPLVINDRVDVALAVEADGVHVGQKDMDARDVRRLVGPDLLIGLSVGSPEEFAASHAALHEVDYVGVGPVRITSTKPDAGAAIGLDGIRRLRGLTSLPIVAIGGIDATMAQATVAAGADGVAVVSAIMAAEDPAVAARAIAAAVKAGRRA